MHLCLSNVDSELILLSGDALEEHLFELRVNDCQEASLHPLSLQYSLQYVLTYEVFLSTQEPVFVQLLVLSDDLESIGKSLALTVTLQVKDVHSK